MVNVAESMAALVFKIGIARSLYCLCYQAWTPLFYSGIPEKCPKSSGHIINCHPATSSSSTSGKKFIDIYELNCSKRLPLLRIPAQKLS